VECFDVCINVLSSKKTIVSKYKQFTLVILLELDELCRQAGCMDLEKSSLLRFVIKVIPYDDLVAIV